MWSSARPSPASSSWRAATRGPTGSSTRSPWMRRRRRSSVSGRRRRDCGGSWCPGPGWTGRRAGCTRSRSIPEGRPGGGEARHERGAPAPPRVRTRSSPRNGLPPAGREAQHRALPHLDRGPPRAGRRGAPGRTLLHFGHYGFPDDPDWEKAWRFFDEGNWPLVLNRLVVYCRDGVSPAWADAEGRARRPLHPQDGRDLRRPGRGVEGLDHRGGGPLHRRGGADRLSRAGPTSGTSAWSPRGRPRRRGEHRAGRRPQRVLAFEWNAPPATRRSGSRDIRYRPVRAGRRREDAGDPHLAGSGPARVGGGPRLLRESLGRGPRCAREEPDSRPPLSGSASATSVNPAGGWPASSRAR